MAVPEPVAPVVDEPPAVVAAVVIGAAAVVVDAAAIVVVGVALVPAELPQALTANTVHADTNQVAVRRSLRSFTVVASGDKRGNPHRDRVTVRVPGNGGIGGNPRSGRDPWKTAGATRTVVSWPTSSSSATGRA